MALLKVIAYGWRQNLVTENAREIRKLGEDLHKRLDDLRIAPAEGVALAGQRGRIVQRLGGLDGTQCAAAGAQVHRARRRPAKCCLRSIPSSSWCACSRVENKPTNADETQN